MPIRVVIADDHSIVRQGLRVFLAQDSEIEVVGDAVDGIAALEIARSLKPDVILMDILMPKMDGIDATRAVRTELPDTQVIALTSVLDDSVVVAAVRAGAIGYLLKDTRADELCRVIRSAALKQIDLSPAVAERLVREMRAPESPDSLTGREAEILRYVATGLSNKEIATRLQVGEKTVKTHVSNILAKLGFQSRTQAALYAVRNGLTSGLPGDGATASPTRAETIERGRVNVLAVRRAQEQAASRPGAPAKVVDANAGRAYARPALRHPA
jgi:two-component system, NarL family, response regulator LiaR